MSLGQVCRLHPNFNPEVRRDISVAIPILDLRRVSDIFFLIFDNVEKHSGVDGQPAIDITVAHERDRLTVEVLSDFQAKEDLEPQLCKIRDIIAGGRFQHMVKSEGGTGLVKIWNIIRNEDVGSQQAARLDFGVRVDRFYVEMDIPFTVVLQEGPLA
jgi:hypothetical protein